MIAKQLRLFRPSPRENYTPQDVNILHIRVLEESLHQLGDGRSNQKNKKEIRAWLKNDDVFPFSFRACCLYAGVNTDTFREQTLALLRRCGNDIQD